MLPALPISSGAARKKLMQQHIHIEHIDQERERFLPLLLEADPSEEMVKRYLGKGYLLVLMLEGESRGVVHLLPTDHEVIEVKNIAVARNFQGQGLGRKLLEYTITFAKQLGYKRCIVGTGNSSISNLAFYQKAGFRFFAVERDFFLSHYPEPIHENGIQCRDLLMLERFL